VGDSGEGEEDWNDEEDGGVASGRVVKRMPVDTVREMYRVSTFRWMRTGKRRTTIWMVGGTDLLRSSPLH
jgi:hypothetical protein